MGQKVRIIIRMESLLTCRRREAGPLGVVAEVARWDEVEGKYREIGIARFRQMVVNMSDRPDTAKWTELVWRGVFNCIVNGACGSSSGA